MAIRPIFLSTNSSKVLFKKENIDFKYFNGFAASQKSKSINALHESAKKLGYDRILEVSTKSENKIGWQLSAFNLMVDFDIDKKISLECAFQGSKVFDGNVQYKDLYYAESIEAKKDERLRNSGNIVGFNFDGIFWENEPKTAFYDYLYIKTLYDNYRDIIDELINYAVFTDIEFNPKRSINCQAKTCATLVSLVNTELLEEAISSKENFIDIVYKKVPKQMSLF